MRKAIPASLISLVADMAAARETHASLDSLFLYAGMPGDPPEGSKHTKALAWLRAMNKDESVDPLKILGGILESWMEIEVHPADRDLLIFRDKVNRNLADAELQYVRGGKIVGVMGTPTRALSEFIRGLDFTSIDQEFERAINNASSSPREAVSAASNILESTCKIIIEEEKLDPPAKQDIQSVWNAVRKHLALDPGRIEDQDIQKILSGLISVVHGLGSLRTHASSAHGAGKKAYKLEPRHARLAIHSAHTLTLFVLETWQKSRTATTNS